MSVIDRTPYQKTLTTKLFSRILAVYLSSRNISKTVTILYEILYEKWPELTKFLKNELSNSNPIALNLLWKISYSSIENIGSIDQIKFGRFLSSNFEKPLRKYQPKNHDEKIYLLQIIKNLNSYEPCV